MFVDHDRWDSFAQLAAALRRAGCRTVQVTTQPHRSAGIVSRLVFDRCVRLACSEERASLPAVLAGERVVDLQCTERHAAWLLEHPDVLPTAVRARLVARLRLFDKLAVARELAASDIRGPDVVPAQGATAAELVVALGLPLVAKARAGAGGSWVSLLAALTEVEHFLKLGAAPLEQVFFQRFVAGDLLGYAAAVGPCGIEEELASRASGTGQDPLGPSAEIEICNDGDLLALGRRVVAALGIEGLVDMDAIRDEAGVVWLIDLNLRAWGSMVATRRVGIDFVGAYLRTLGLECTCPECPATLGGTRVRVLPRSLDATIRSGRLLASLRQFLRESWPYLRDLGARYRLAEVVGMAISLRNARGQASVA